MQSNKLLNHARRVVRVLGPWEDPLRLFLGLLIALQVVLVYALGAR